jgi:hypothetical protein
MLWRVIAGSFDHEGLSTKTALSPCSKIIVYALPPCC